MDDKHFSLLLEMSESLGSLHTKVDNVRDTLTDHKKEDEKKHHETDARVSSLESARTAVRGGYAVLVVSVAVVSTLLTALASAWAGK